MNETPRKLTNLASDLGADIDLFICSSSFEERCLSIPENIDQESIKEVFIAKNQSFSSVVSNNFERLSKLFQNKCSPLIVDSSDPVLSAQNIVAALEGSEGSKGQRVVIDITTFTHESLLILVRVCNAVFGEQDTVEFLYAPASEYSIPDEPENKWLSKGIREIRSVIGYPGEFIPSRSTHLILLAGFEDYRALSLVRDVEPSLVSIGYGDRSEASTKPHQVTNEVKARRIRSILGAVEDFTFSCYDPILAEKKLKDVIANAGDYNTIIAPMNTKISTLGVARCGISNTQVQVCYAQAEVYNYRSYSRPGEEYYRFRFDDWPIGVD